MAGEWSLKRVILIKVYEKQTQPILEFYAGKVPFVNFRCEAMDLPPETAVGEILQGLGKIGLYKG